MGGGKRTRDRALPKNAGPLQKKRASGLLSRGFVYRRNRATRPEGVETVPVPYEGGPNPFLGGVSFVRFSSPLFFVL